MGGNMKIRCNNCHAYTDIPFSKIGREQELCCNCGRYFYGTELKTVKIVRAIFSVILSVFAFYIIQAMKIKGYSTLEAFLAGVAVSFSFSFLSNVVFWIYLRARNRAIENCYTNP